MFTQLDPPLPLHVLDKGDGLALAVIDYGPEHNLIWVTALDANGEVWCAPNPQIRMQRNWSMGRKESPMITAAKAQARQGHSSVCADCSDVLARA